MAAKSLRTMFGRTLKSISDETRKTLNMSRLNPNPTDPLVFSHIRSEASLEELATGCDGDFGGLSTVKLDLDSDGKGRFSGNLSDKVHSKMMIGGRRVDRSGFAGFRTKLRPTLFSQLYYDSSQYNYLKLRLRNSGDAMRYFVNIQAQEPMEMNVYQHRLWLGPMGKWDDVLVPFSEFTFTNSASGRTQDLSSAAVMGPNVSPHRSAFPKDRIATVGISVLGPNHGPYELGVESIEAVNVEAHSTTRNSTPTSSEFEDDDEGVSAAEALERARKRAAESLNGPAPEAAPTARASEVSSRST